MAALSCNGIDADAVAERSQNDIAAIAVIRRLAALGGMYDKACRTHKTNEYAQQFLSVEHQPESHQPNQERKQRRQGIEYARCCAVDMRLGSSEQKRR